MKLVKSTPYKKRQESFCVTHLRLFSQKLQVFSRIYFVMVNHMYTLSDMPVHFMLTLVSVLTTNVFDFYSDEKRSLQFYTKQCVQYSLWWKITMTLGIRLLGYFVLCYLGLIVFGFDSLRVWWVNKCDNCEVFQRV